MGGLDGVVGSGWSAAGLSRSGRKTDFDPKKSVAGNVSVDTTPKLPQVRPMCSEELRRLNRMPQTTFWHSYHRQICDGWDIV